MKFIVVKPNNNQENEAADLAGGGGVGRCTRASHTLIIKEIGIHKDCANRVVGRCNSRMSETSDEKEKRSPHSLDVARRLRWCQGKKSVLFWMR